MTLDIEEWVNKLITSIVICVMCLWLLNSAISSEVVSLACKRSEFQCQNRRCVPSNRFCNSVNDCGDNTDEPRFCTPCNRTFYGEIGVTYEMEIHRPNLGQLPFVCPLSFTAAGQQFGDIVQDEKNQVLTTNCWITQIWTDYKLKWNVSQHSGITVIRIPYDKVWRPDVILYNNADSQYNQGVINTNVIVSYTGEVLWLSHGIYRSSCDIDVQYFPFDVQSCTLKWASWTYDGYQNKLSDETNALYNKTLDLVKQTEEGDTSNYKANGEFDLVSFDITRNVVNYSCCPEPYPDITYIIRLKRRPMFYVFNLIVPCILINCIALLVFYVPSESGEKVTLGISALLSMTVFLMTIRETLPPTEKTPLIGLYYGVSICLVTFASGFSVVTLNIYHRGVRGTKVPEIIKTIVLGKMAKFLWLHFDPPPKYKNSANTGTMPSSLSNRNSYLHNFNEAFNIPDEANILRCCCNRIDPTIRSPIFTNKQQRTNSSKNTNHQKTPSELETQFLIALNHVKQAIERNELRLCEHELREVTEREWKQVSLVCDRFLLLVFMISTAVTTILILRGSPYGP